MNIEKILKIAGVPAALAPDAVAAMKRADKDSDGLMWSKWRVRLSGKKVKQIVDSLDWADERLVDKRKDLADWDIAPMLNITAHGDNVPWDEATGRPAPGQWLNDDPSSDEFKAAVAANYWSKGNHPRSKKSRTAWYKRNSGEFRAWRLGMPANLSDCETWSNGGATVYRCGESWQVNYDKKLVGKLMIRTRIGYEISNIVRDGIQLWYPAPGYDLRAPLTWSVLPGWGKVE